jgi:V/A-type H+-transporting ATPase subunit A
MEYGKYAYKALDSGVSIQDILKIKSRDLLANVKFEKEFDKYLKKAVSEMKKEFQTMGVEAI